MSRNNQFYLYTAILIVVLMGSCRARFYTPNRNPVPLFKNSGDLYIDGSTNMMTKMDFTAGAAVAKGLGGYIGYSGAYQTSSSDSGSAVQERRRYNGKMLNLGFGYFLNRDISENFRFEIYADYATGTFKNRISGDRSEFFNGNFKRVGIMPNIGYSSSDGRFDMAYSARFSRISFSNASFSDTVFWNYDLERYNRREYYNMLEHSITFRGGSEKVKFQVQLASYHGLNSDDLANAIPFWNASVMFGIVFTPSLKGY